MIFKASAGRSKQRLSGTLSRNTPKAIHLSGKFGVVLIPMSYVEVVEYDNESEQQ